MEQAMGSEMHTGIKNEHQPAKPASTLQHRERRGVNMEREHSNRAGKNSELQKQKRKDQVDARREQTETQAGRGKGPENGKGKGKESGGKDGGRGEPPPVNQQ